MGRGWTSERSLNIPHVNNGAADLLLALFSETLFTCLCSGSTAVLFNMPSVSLLQLRLSHNVDACDLRFDGAVKVFVFFTEQPESGTHHTGFVFTSHKQGK